MRGSCCSRSVRSDVDSDCDSVSKTDSRGWILTRFGRGRGMRRGGCFFLGLLVVVISCGVLKRFKSGSRGVVFGGGFVFGNRRESFGSWLGIDEAVSVDGRFVVVVGVELYLGV